MNEDFTTRRQRIRRLLRSIGRFALVLGMAATASGCVIARLPTALSSRVVSQVYMQRGDTLTEISPGMGEGLFVTPSVSPAGDEAVFHGAVTGYSRIWRYTLEDETSVALTADDYVAVEPSYSWDGTLIAFAADKGIDQKREDMFKIGNSLLKMGQMYLGGSPKAMNIYIMNCPASDGFGGMAPWS